MYDIAFSDGRARSTGHYQYSDDDQNIMTAFAPPASASAFTADMGFDDTGQTWMWSDNFNFR